MKNKKKIIKILKLIIAFTLLILMVTKVEATSYKTTNGYRKADDEISFEDVNTNSVNMVASDTSGPASRINILSTMMIKGSAWLTLILGIFLLIKGIIVIVKRKQKRGIIYILISFASLFGSFWLQAIKTFKPIIYIYPEEEKEVKVKLGKKEKLTCTYPKYEEEWNVKAKPNGDLIDLKTGRKLYALYWEGLNTNKQSFEDGFIVEGENVASFLEEKLEILGLNEREAEEFIVYWLPQMEHNKYNYIRFETMDEISENMPLEINPKPETLIRINMVFRPLRKMIDIKEQKLKQIDRIGYTVVEWGGSKL